MKHASNVLIVQDGLVLSVSRRNDSTKWGLPGGKVDHGELSINAAMREAMEETCVIIYRHELQPLVSMRSFGEVDYWTTTYLYTGPRVKDQVPAAEPGFFIGWKTFEELTDPNVSPFAEYNKVVQNHYEDYTRG